MFESTIHEDELPKVAKFTYLKGSSRGPAAAATAGIAVTNDNYSTVVQILREKYGKKDVVVHRTKAGNAQPRNLMSQHSKMCTPCTHPFNRYPLPTHA